MKKNARVRRHPVADVSRIPGFFGRIDRHVHHDRRSDYIIARNKTPIAAVVRIIPVVTHHEIFTGWDGYWSVIVGWVGRVRAVGFLERLAVDGYDALANFQFVARQPN